MVSLDDSSVIASDKSVKYERTNVNRRDYVSLINADRNEMESPDAQFSRNETTDKKLNVAIFTKICTNSRNETCRKYCTILKSDKVKAVFTILVISSLFFLFYHVITINSELNEMMKSLEKERSKINKLEKKEKPNTLNYIEKITKLEKEFEDRKVQLDNIEESHRNNLVHIKNTHESHKVQLDLLTDKLAAKENKLDQIEATVRNQNESFYKTLVDMEDMKGIENNEFLPPISTNGVLVWKVTNISQRVADARNDKHEWIYSDPFYTNQYGYKLCLSLRAVGWFRSSDILAVSYHLMKSEMDDILSWPFTYNVTISVINQSTYIPTIVGSLLNVPYEKPTKVTGWSVLKSVVLITYQALTEKFIQNDALYIKVEVGVE